MYVLNSSYGMFKFEFEFDVVLILHSFIFIVFWHCHTFAYYLQRYLEGSNQYLVDRQLMCSRA